MDHLTQEQRARVDALLAWSRRKDDLATELTEGEWAQLRLDLRSECANHHKDEELYGLATGCEHDVPAEDRDYEDKLHQWNYEDDVMLCLGQVVGHTCSCEGTGCSQTSSAEEAREDLWYAVSDRRRSERLAAHLSDLVAKAWLDSPLPYEQVLEIAANSPTAEKFHQAIAAAINEADA